MNNRHFYNFFIAIYARLILRLSNKYKSILSDLLYGILAPKYDLISDLISKGLWHKWQLEVLNEIKGKVVLDLACGTARLAVEMPKFGYTVFGIDRSSDMLKACSVNSIYMNTKLLLVQANNTAIPAKNKIFDSVFITFPTDIILDKKLYEEVYRVLKPGGRIVIVDFPKFHHGFINFFLNILLNLLNKKTMNDLLKAIPKSQYSVEIKTVIHLSSSINIIIADKLKK